MNFKKKIAAIATAAVCSLSIAGVSGKNVDDLNVYAASVTGKSAFEITNDMTIGWNLGNSLDCANTGSSYNSEPKYAVTKWGNPEPTQELFDAVKAAGFNTVRIPTTWYEHIQKDSNGDWEISPSWMAYVKKTVDFAYNNDMYVILNVHHEDWVNVEQFTDTTKAVAAEKLEDIWKQISEEFKDYDQRLIFEGMNEPRQRTDPNDPNQGNVEWGGGYQYSWDYINDLNEIFVDTVRSQGSSANNERLLMLPGYDASSGVNTVRAIDIPEGSGNVALSVHAYLPYYFGMATDDKANHTYPGQSGWGADYTQELQQFFSNMKSVISEKNVPIIIGEFSASDFNNTDSRVAWAKDYMKYAEDANIPCVLWDNNAVLAEGATPNGENHSYINRKTNTWYESSVPVVKAMVEAVGVTNYDIPVYTAGDFSWSNIKIGSDWIELFRSENGQTPLSPDGTGDWANIDIPGFKNYLNENYKIVMIAKSAKDPTVVPMANGDGGWIVVANDGTSKQDYVYNYSYADMKSAVEAAGFSMSDVTNFFANANGAPITVYGLYAVPVNSQPESTESTEATTQVETTEATTTATTKSETIASETETTTVTTTTNTNETEETTTPITPVQPSKIGDVNCDGSVGLADAIAFARYNLNEELYPLKNEVAYANADVNHDNQLNESDLELLNEFNLQTITHF